MKSITLLRIKRLVLCSLWLSSGTAAAGVVFSSPAANNTWYLTHRYDICWTRTADMQPPASLSIEQASGAGMRIISHPVNDSGLSACFSWGVYHDLPQVPHRICLDIGMIGGMLHKECSEPFSILAPSELSVNNANVIPDPRDATDLLTYTAMIRAEGPDIPESVGIQFKVYGLGGAELLNEKKKLDFTNSTTHRFKREYRVPLWGLYRNELIIDTKGVVLERDEGNNKEVTLYAVDPKPDLQVYVNPDIPAVYKFKRRGIRAYVKNVGSRVSPQSELRFWISKKGGKSYTVPKLQPGKTWSVMREPKWAIGGAKGFKVTVYPGNEIEELSKKNNMYEGSVWVKTTHKFDRSGLAPPPDLRVRVWMAKSIKIGTKTPVLLLVHNRGKVGDKKAENITLKTTLYGAVNNPQGPPSDLVKTFNIPELLPGEKHFIVQNIETTRPINTLQRFKASVRTSAGQDRNKNNNQIIRDLRITN